MDVFSLEEEDANELFITQKAKGVCDNEEFSDENNNILGLDVMDFRSPCVSIIRPKEAYSPECSDISEMRW